MWHKLANKMSLETIEELLKERDFEVISTKMYLGSMVATVVIERKTDIV
jgi:hypothetical protein